MGFNSGFKGLKSVFQLRAKLFANFSVISTAFVDDTNDANLITHGGSRKLGNKHFDVENLFLTLMYAWNLVYIRTQRG